MMAPLIALAARWGVVERLRKPVAWLMALGLTLALLALFWGGWRAFDWFNDRQAVARDVDHSNAEVRGRQVQAERSAGAAQQQRDDGIRNEQFQQEEKAHEARRANRSALDALHNEL
ncbi:hypothetical protein S2M10_29210 [Sphingomonas sp. S2M10]|uniref:hypothetical protein n=1 Tax=Sphingomonas sp. S2M10 TaxID=2705010 RepID=UPI001456CFF2|nr:hypothetical protein [Sphingomonas sp. S2M10]NLS27919.1 hypothetical protein [Sphingomonas sp. S2M10]